MKRRLLYISIFISDRKEFYYETLYFCITGFYDDIDSGRLLGKCTEQQLR